jgi:hypothetical protein
MAKKKATKGGAVVYMVLDASGSMEWRRNEVIEGCNRFISETREADPEARFSLLTFDTSVDRLYSAQPLKEVQPITGQQYRPGGGTALNDAIGYAVKDIEGLKDKPSKVVVAIFTDGQENSSTEYRREDVKASVARHENEDGWQFLFLAANLDAFAEATSYGTTRASNNVNWNQGVAGGTYAVMAAAAGGASSYLGGSTFTADVSQSAYDSALADLQANGGQLPDTTNLTVDEKVNLRAAKQSIKTGTTTTSNTP